MTVSIKFLTEFDGKALARAEKGLTKFTKTAVKLAGGLGIALGTSAITRYAKASVKAFADDDKAARILSKSLDNLGLRFADNRVKEFIAALEQQFGVLDDLLRPAYQKLLTTTGDYLKSQDLLKTALDLAAFSQESVTTTAADLAKAYAGNTRGLIKYGIGLTKAEIAAMSFEEILERIAKVSQGAALTAANSYSGSMDRLNVAAANASETIGKGLVQALSEASGAGNFEGAISDIDKLAKRTEDFIVYLGRELQLIAALPSLIDLATGNFDSFKDFLKTYEKIQKLDNAMGPQQFGGIYGTKYEKEAAAAALKKLAADKRAAAAKIAADKKAAADKKTLAKGNAVFELEQIGLTAALKMSIDKETRLRLELLQAIQLGDADLVLAKMKELAEWQKNSDITKLSRITTISEKQLSALNTTLLAELEAISKLKVSDEEKSRLQQEAWGRYNDAIKYAGGLAALSTYSQKLQDQELLIQRLASIQKVSEAQAAADAIRQAALDKYLATLGKPIAVQTTTAPTPILGKSVIEALKESEAEKILKKEPSSVPTSLTPGEISGNRYAAQGKAQMDALISKIDLEGIAGVSFAQGIGSGLSIADSLSGARYAAQGRASMGSGDTVINFNAPITTTSTDEFSRVVQQVIQNEKRFGNNLDYAGAI